MMLIVVIILFALIFHFEPYPERLLDGNWIIWYNLDRRTKTRTYKIIKWK